MRRLLLFAVMLFVPLAGCPDDSPSTDPPPASPSAPPPAAPNAPPGPEASWRGYPEPSADSWPLRPLDDARWVAASSELGCVGRSHHGDPAAHRRAMRAVLSHHETDADAVMAYGIAVNADPSRAALLGPQVAERVVSCR